MVAIPTTASPSTAALTSSTMGGNSGPELRGANITLEKILQKTDTSSRQTKIICTLGPACWEVEQLEALIDAGLNVARFNFSHGDHAGHKACLDRLREAAANKKKHVAVLLDTKGPEIRSGFFADGAKKISLVKGETRKFVVVCDGGAVCLVLARAYTPHHVM